MNPSIFREYDIRGLIDPDLVPENVRLLGMAFGAYFHYYKARRIVLGQDCRLSSPPIALEIAEALKNSGCSIIDLGVCPTPAMYFAIHYFQADGGIMVTASHNPPEFNGFKICLGKQTIFGREIQKIRQISQGRQFVRGKGSLEQYNIIPDYLDFLLQNLKPIQALKVGLDGGHGTAGPVAQELFQRMGCQVFPLYCQPDGLFPVHLPDPTVPENLVDLRKLVNEKSLALGLAYDGDGDRLGVIAPDGRIVWGDQLTILFAKEILKENPGATIIGEVKCSQVMYDTIAKLGGKPLMWKTGHSLIKQKMSEEKALLAGEMSGHLFFADRYLGYDDALYASGRLLELLSESNKSLTELLDELPAAINSPEIRWYCPDERKFQVVEAVKNRVRNLYPVVDIDGVRMQLPGGWALVRASNTQPALVLRFEAETESRLAEIQDEVTGIIQTCLAALEDWK